MRVKHVQRGRGWVAVLLSGTEYSNWINQETETLDRVYRGVEAVVSSHGVKRVAILKGREIVETLVIE